jgi:hypothetical protein
VQIGKLVTPPPFGQPQGLRETVRRSGKEKTPGPGAPGSIKLTLTGLVQGSAGNTT